MIHLTMITMVFSFINSNTGFVITNSGKLLKTTNKGGNWNNIYSCNTQLNSIYSDLPVGCFAVGNSGIVLSSNNYGYSWAQNNLTTKALNCIKFINSTTGFICGDSGKIFKTINGGNNWTQISSPVINNLTSISFVNNILWICGGLGVILKSTDSGNNWSLIYTISVFDNFGIHFINELTGYTINYVNQVYPNPDLSSIYATTNGGSNWTLKYQYSFQQMGGVPKMTSINFVDQLTGYITTTNGDLLLTQNGGVNFALYRNIYNVPIYSSTFTDPNSIWIVGTHGLIASSLEINVGIRKLDNVIPDRYRIFQNYPNPFNPVTKVKFDVPKSSVVNISIYDLSGRLIETLTNHSFSTGKYEISWNADKYSSGVYFCKLNSDEYSKTIKMLLIK